MTVSNGILKRSDNGRFAPGTNAGPGRPAGTPNKTTIDLRTIRDAFVASWEQVNGPELLKQLAIERPYEYLRLVVSLLPKERELHLSNEFNFASESNAYIDRVRASTLAELRAQERGTEAIRQSSPQK